MAVLIALGFGALLIHPAKQTGQKISPQKQIEREPISLKTWIGILVTAAFVLLGILFAWRLQNDIGRMALSLFKIGAVAFGNGLSIIPLIQADVVEKYHYLTMNQFADGIALGQITPGLFLITAAFIGYKLVGFGAAILETFAMFSPSFVMTLVFTEIFSRIRDLTIVRGAMAGVLASFVGMLADVILQLSNASIKSPASIAMAAGAFVAVRWFKLDVLWVFIMGILIWLGLMSLGLMGG